jgi:hypothetical protein
LRHAKVSRDFARAISHAKVSRDFARAISHAKFRAISQGQIDVPNGGFSSPRAHTEQHQQQWALSAIAGAPLGRLRAQSCAPSSAPGTRS